LELEGSVLDSSDDGKKNIGQEKKIKGEKVCIVLQQEIDEFCIMSSGSQNKPFYEFDILLSLSFVCIEQHRKKQNPHVFGCY